MTELVRRCDRCKRKDAEPFMIVRQIGGQDTEVDLCSTCTSLLLKRVVLALTPAQQTRITQEVLAYGKDKNAEA